MHKIFKPMLLVMFILTACESKIEKFIQGTWTIDKLYYDNKNVRPYFFPNAILFKKDTCIIPIPNVNQLRTKKEYGIWKIYEKDNKRYIKITTENPFFNDVYEITRIWRDCNNNGCLFRMSLKSDSTDIECCRHDLGLVEPPEGIKDEYK